MTRKISDFIVLDALASEDGPIYSANVNSNVIEIRRTKRGYELTIGVSYIVGDLIMEDKLIGAIYFADSDTFFAKKRQLEAEG